MRELSLKQKILGGAALACGLLGLAAIIVVPMMRSAVSEKSVGRASVQSARSEVLEEPRPGGRRLFSLEPGTQVNLLERITSRDQAWARVQYVSPKKNSPPGYVRVKDLGQWASDDPQVAWDFIGFLRPTERAPDHELRNFLSELRRFSKRFETSPEAFEADLEWIKVHMTLVIRSKIASQPASYRKQDLEKTKQALDLLKPPSARYGEVASLRRKVEALIAFDATPNPSSPLAPSTQQQIDDLEQKVRVLWRQARLDEALGVVTRIEDLDPANAKAQWWKKQITDAKRELGQ